MPKPKGGGKYFSLLVSPNMSMTAEGYLICENVPLCRSGYQDYLGKELQGFDGYDEAWGLDPNKIYSVYRPPEEVLDADFIRSLEGKTVVDEHPEGNVVHIDNEEEVNCGHAEKVARGPDVDGEVTLQGDLHIKNSDLIDKIRPPEDPNNEYGSAVREVSVGYGLKLGRLDDGQIVMRKLRGNHVAVVRRGRAGPQIAIADSAPPEIQKPKERKVMKLRDLLLGRGLKSVIPDITPEQENSILAELAEPTPAVAVDSATAPAPAATPTHEEKEEMHPAHKHLEGFLKAKEAGDSEAAAFHKGELMKHLGHEEHHEPEKVEELEEHRHEEHKAGDEELEQDEKTPAEEHAEEHATDEKVIDDPGDSVLKAANDSAINFIKSTRPVVAAIVAKPRSKRTSSEQVMVDSYNEAVRKVNNSKGRVYSHLARVRVPDGIPTLATDSKSTSPAPINCSCFDGVPYKTGLARHQANCQKGNN